MDLKLDKVNPLPGDGESGGVANTNQYPLEYGTTPVSQVVEEMWVEKKWVEEKRVEEKPVEGSVYICVPTIWGDGISEERRSRKSKRPG